MSIEPWPTILLDMPRTLPDAVREKFTQALFILSQSDTGRYLLEEAKKDGYTLSTVPPEVTGIRGRAAALPLKRIQLSTTLEPEVAALTLAHECAHILQFRTKLGNDAHCQFPDGLRMVFAFEADAHAHAGQVAAELALGKGSGWTSHAPMDIFAKDFPLSATITKYLLRMEPQSLDNGELMAEVFKTFYQTPGLRTQYEAGHIQNCEAAVTRIDKTGFIGKFAKTLLFNKKIPPDALLNKALLHKTRPYVKEHIPDIDLTSALFCGVSLLTKNRMVNILNNLGRKEEATAAEHAIPVLDQMNAAEETLRLWRVKQSKKNDPKNGTP